MADGQAQQIGIGDLLVPDQKVGWDPVLQYADVIRPKGVRV